MCLVETIKRLNNLEKLFNALITIMPTSVEPDRAFSAMEPICYKTQEQNE